MEFEELPDMNEKLMEKIISVAYNDASIIDKIYIRILAFRRRDVKELLAEYQNTAREIHTIKEEEFSEEKVRQIYAKTGIKEAGKSALLNDIFSVFIGKPVMASAMVFVLAAILVTTIFVKNRSVEITYSDEEIITAAYQTKHVFEAINEVFNQTRVLVQEKALKENVAKPISESYKKISKIIKEGEIK